MPQSSWATETGWIVKERYNELEVQVAVAQAARRFCEWMDERPSIKVRPVVVLTGGMTFATDFLLRASAQVEPDRILPWTIVKCKSYVGLEQTEGIMINPIEEPEVGEDEIFLILDDIVDGGKTMACVQAWLEEAYKPAAVLKACAINRPHKRVTGKPYSKVDFAAFTPDSDDWYFGYGMDLDGKYRHLGGIYAEAASGQ